MCKMVRGAAMPGVCVGVFFVEHLPVLSWFEGSLTPSSSTPRAPRTPAGVRIIPRGWARLSGVICGDVGFHAWIRLSVRINQKRNLNGYQVLVYAWRVPSGLVHDGGIYGEVVTMPIFACAVFHRIRWSDAGRGIVNADLRVYIFSSDLLFDNVMFLPYEDRLLFHCILPSVIFQTEANASLQQ